ncbi:ABC transporter permease [Spongiactinospora gelatinilytica]|uniref:Transport permease protein n=1 Tax=Spongiactinospora gelatinilytica TaxID=2666298 RepID=A0A2W2FLK4_9ACTN|nr:ABC transporter permease [Spongiactinospora gelatinilytica]PZG38226.1 ABC transporter permease [Spongiactinospora gelatinilytica]
MTAVAQVEQWSHPGSFTQLRLLTARQLRHAFADRRAVVLNLVQPLVMLTLFGQIFGSIAGPGALPGGVRYLDYLMPALLVTTGIGAAQHAGIVLVREMGTGMTARLRSLPVNLRLVLVARAVTDLTRAALQLLVLLACGAALFGFVPSGGVPGMVGALVLALAVIWSLIWVFLLIAAWLRSLEVLTGIAFLVTYPLMFASSAFVPVEKLPGWLRAVATLNPVTYAIDAARDLTIGGGSAASPAVGLAATAPLGVAAMLAAFRAFRRPLSR